MARATTAKVNENQNAVQAFYLANLFHDHLKAAPINFTDRPFEGVDKLQLNTDDGVDKSLSQHENNANMLTWADGRSPLMQMYLWTTPHRAMNGGDDASILFHEYTHGLTNRLVVDADGAGALNSAQAGAMGEGWSDWYAKDFLVKQWPAIDTATPGDVSMGDYTDTATRPFQIRTQGLDCPVGAVSALCPHGGYTYGDFGHVDSGPEVHADGEIWAETLWDLRNAIGWSDAERIITDALRLSPPEPSFLDERNAILQADLVDGTGHHDAIWQVFATRGMGFYATSEDGGDTDSDRGLQPPADRRDAAPHALRHGHRRDPPAPDRRRDREHRQPRRRPGSAHRDDRRQRPLHAVGPGLRLRHGRRSTRPAMTARCGRPT